MPPTAPQPPRPRPQGPPVPAPSQAQGGGGTCPKTTREALHHARNALWYAIREEPPVYLYDVLPDAPAGVVDEAWRRVRESALRRLGMDPLLSPMGADGEPR